MLDLGEWVDQFRLLIRDGDTRFTGSFDAVSTAQGVRVIRTPRAQPRERTLLQNAGYVPLGVSVWTRS
jgi:hypothetical protein